MNNLTFKVGINQTTFHINNLSINCIVNYEPDSDELILCVHGLGCDKDTFKQIFDYPEFENYNIIIPDLIGFGQSSKPENFSYELEEQTSVLTYLIKQFDIKRIHLLAHSMGGAIVLLLPKYILDKVDSFANLEGNLISTDCEMFSKKIAAMPKSEFNEDCLKQYQNTFKDSILLKLNSTTPTALYHSSKSLVKWSESNNLLKEFKKLNTRKAYFYGEENLGSDLLTQLNGIERVMIAHSGHEMMVENPDEFYNRFYDFINNNL